MKMELKDLFIQTGINSLESNTLLKVKQYKQGIWNYNLI